MIVKPNLSQVSRIYQRNWQAGVIDKESSDLLSFVLKQEVANCKYKM